MACMQHSRDHYGNSFLVMRSTPSPEAPFEIKSEEGIEIMNHEDFSSEDLNSKIRDFSPALLYVAGWTNPFYLSVAKDYKKKGCPVVVGMDNHWKATFKQRIAGLLSSLYIKPYFTDIWIPGSPQYKFAKHLGFKAKHIHKGLYCANTQLFKAEPKAQKKNELLFVGRLVEHKGLPQFIEVINRLIAKQELDFSIKFIGNGPFADQLPKHENITHISFMSSERLPDLLHHTGFLILPSTYEAWGVVVHEALLSATPVISTHQCGAAVDLVEHKKGGYLFDSNSFEELKDILKEVSQLTDHAYEKMSKNALKSSEQIDIAQWSQTLQDIAKQ